MGRAETKHLTATTWQIVKTQRPLWNLVVRGVVFAGLVGLVIAGGGILFVASDSGPLLVVGIILIVIAAFVGTAIWMFHAGALAYAADVALRTGTSPTAGEALKATSNRRTSLAGWAAITVIVGWLLSLLRGDGGGGGAGGAAIAIIRLIGAGVLAAAWSIITFFVVPVIVLEGGGPIDAIKRSSHLIKSRWGSQVGGRLRLGGMVVLLTILPAIVFGGLGFLLVSTGQAAGEIGGVALFVLGAVLLVIGSVVMSALSAVFGVALYRFAGDGQAVGPFTPAELETAVQLRR